MCVESEISLFFKNQTLFLTGGSGFLGKVLIEKILRECEIKKLYVLLRPKKNLTPEERFNALFNYPCFDGVKAKDVDLLKKVSLINGDCQEPMLGMSQQDIRILLEETTCVIHAAASVKFDQPLKEGAFNVRATRDLLELAKIMSKLRVFVHISTAYSNCLNSHIKEEFYEPPMSAEDLLTLVDAVDDETLKSITPAIIGKWPNTYIYTKCISEDLIKKAAKDVPVVLVRPSIVIGSAEEPVPGWLDNFYGAIGVVLVAALGVARSLHAKLDATASVVPVDYVANCTLAAARKREKSGTTGVYNFVTAKENQLTWSQFMRTVRPHCEAAASEKVVWHFCFKLRESKFWHTLAVFFQHTVLAHVVDAILFCAGKPTIAVKNYQRLDSVLDALSYFSTRNWSFDYTNVLELWNDLNERDKNLYKFDMRTVDWDRLLGAVAFGGRMYLLKDTTDTLPKGRRKIKFLFVAHHSLMAVGYALLGFLLYKFFVLILGF